MIHPATELRLFSPQIGYGVFATKSIPRGTITWTADPLDQQFTAEQVSALPPVCADAVRRYAYVDPHGAFVLCWDHGRFVNHSCEPNCLSAGFQFEFAVRDIAAGEQLTDDYGMMNLLEPMSCECGAPNCRGLIGDHDFERHATRWDAIVSAAFPSIGTVDQPLWPLIENAAEIQTILRGEATIPSCRFHSSRA